MNLTAIQRLRQAVKDKTGEKVEASAEKLSLIKERYKFLDSKLRDAKLIEVAIEYYDTLQEGEDKDTVTEAFIAGVLYKTWLDAVSKQKI